MGRLNLTVLLLRCVTQLGKRSAVSIRIVDDHTVKVTSKKAGKPAFKQTDIVSPDGNALTQVVQDPTGEAAVTCKNVLRPIAPATPGAHVLSGSWQIF
jgi:hypothetical protein